MLLNILIEIAGIFSTETLGEILGNSPGEFLKGTWEGIAQSFQLKSREIL